MSYANAEAALSFDKPETVKAFLDAGALDHKMLPKLEEYVAHQVRTEPPSPAPPLEPILPMRVQAKNNKYDFEANRQLLKLYQFKPAAAKVDVLAKVLLKVSRWNTTNVKKWR
jgi:hypothetical protein